MADLQCYRGEPTSDWGDPDIRLICGLTVRSRWGLDKTGVFSASACWRELLTNIARERKFGKGNVDAYAQTLRQSGKAYAIATARTASGSMETAGRANYAISIQNARVYRWPKQNMEATDNFDLGAEEPKWVDDPRQVDAHYIVLNAATIIGSTVLGFGHHAGTGEVTFFTDIPTDWVTTVNGKARSTVAIKKREDLTMDQKAGLMRSLLR